MSAHTEHRKLAAPWVELADDRTLSGRAGSDYSKVKAVPNAFQKSLEVLQNEGNAGTHFHPFCVRKKTTGLPSHW
jgi:hypothetical protein